jgi:Polyketide cyclase / dehydrase and lipid transport
MGIVRIIKFAGLSLLTLFVVLTGLSLLFPANVRVSRVINVAAPRQKVYDAVSDFHAWGHWNDFVRASPLTNIKYSSPSYGPGATLHSDQLLITMKEADSNGVLLNWNLTGGKTFVGAFQLLSQNADSITVQWWFDFHFRWYPWEKLGVFVYDRKLGPVMEESLKGLKLFVENSR